MKEIWVGGYPSFYGGADTELDHNIDLWLANGVEVNLVPMHGCDQKMREVCDARGCKTHKYEPGIFKDKIVCSFCNGNFLDALPQIYEKGKPAAVVWFNCMTWTFPKELSAHRAGMITHFGFVSKYQKTWLLKELKAANPNVNELEGYRPYFNLDSPAQKIKFSYREPKEYFGAGRLSRDDGGKYSSDMWSIFNKVCTPGPKKIFVLGYGQNAHKKCGSAPPGLDWQTWLPGQIPVSEFYTKVHCIIHKTGGSRESYCRIVPEAFAAGVPMVVEDNYAFPELIVNGHTGYRCKSSDEMAFRASELAFNETRRKHIIEEARCYLANEIASKERCWKAWEPLWK